MPGLDLGARFIGMRRPPRGGLRQGRGRADQDAFFARGTATLVGRLVWYLVELGPARKTPHYRGCLGQLTDIVLGGVAAVSQATELTPRLLLGHEVKGIPGQLTAGMIRHVEGIGLVGLRIQCQPNWDAEAVAGPTLEGECA